MKSTYLLVFAASLAYTAPAPPAIVTHPHAEHMEIQIWESTWKCHWKSTDWWELVDFRHDHQVGFLMNERRILPEKFMDPRFTFGAPNAMGRYPEAPASSLSFNFGSQLEYGERLVDDKGKLGPPETMKLKVVDKTRHPPFDGTRTQTWILDLTRTTTPSSGKLPQYELTGMRLKELGGKHECMPHMTDPNVGKKAMSHRQKERMKDKGIVYDPPLGIAFTRHEPRDWNVPSSGETAVQETPPVRRRSTGMSRRLGTAVGGRDARSHWALL